jgi:hypothetical protein
LIIRAVRVRWQGFRDSRTEIAILIDKNQNQSLDARPDLNGSPTSNWRDTQIRPEPNPCAQTAERFPFLEGRAPGSDWRSTPARPCPIHNRTVLHLLGALQFLEMKAPGGGREKRRLSFRALDIEQIGHVYEGLLDHTARRATEIVLGLDGKEEPEVALSEVNPTVTWQRGQPAPPTGRC